VAKYGLMKSKSRSSSARSRQQKHAHIPLNELIEELLERAPEVMRSGSAKKARDAYVMLAAYEGVMAMAEYFEKIQEKRRVWRSDLVFRFEVVPGRIGRAAQAEQESRAIDAVLEAAARSAER
jgi:hypothetical protein